MDVYGIPNRPLALSFCTAEMKLAERSLFEGHENYIHIFGPRRHGKTATCEYLNREFKGQQGVVLTIDLRGYSHADDARFLERLYLSSLDSLKQTKQSDVFYRQASVLPSPEEKGKLLFTKLTNLSDEVGAPLCLILEEADHIFLKNKANGSVLLEFLKCQKEVGNKSKLSIITTSLPPLPWMASDDADKEFVENVAHLRIRKLPKNFASSLEKAIPYGKKEYRLDFAEKTWRYTGGHPGLIAEMIFKLQGSGEIWTPERFVSEIERGALCSAEMMQITPSQEYFEHIPVHDFEQAKGAYDALSASPSEEIIQTDPVSALHLALSGFVECADDGVKIGPIVPFFQGLAKNRASFARFSPHKSCRSSSIEYKTSTTKFRQLFP